MTNQLVLSKILSDEEAFVKKLVFESADAIAETVLYNYQDRVVVCFSTQSGCPVGCVFCGTGNRFIRDLSAAEMLLQIDEALKLLPALPEKIQIMAMSMGEPMLNWQPTKDVVFVMLERDYSFFISTIGIRNQDILDDFIYLGKRYPKFGVQFSLHKCSDEGRLKLFRNKSLSYLDISHMIQFANDFFSCTGSLVYFNYIATGKETVEELEWLANYLIGCHLTCSVKCSTKQGEKADPQVAIELARAVYDMSEFLVDVSVFDPAGQDTIGGGCGQLLYVQEKLKEQK